MTSKQTASFDPNNNGNLFDNLARASCNAGDGLPGSNEQPIMCVGDDDTRQDDVSGSILNFRKTSEKCQTTPVRGADATNARQSATASTKTSDWHLLDVDGHSVAASSTSSSCYELDTIHELPVLEERRQRLQIGARDEMTNKMETNSSRKQTRQVSNRRQIREEHLSPTLIRSCTLLYALLPAASSLAFFTLLWLIFTKYWFITVFYYTYVFLDRKTYNTGGRRMDAVYNSKFWAYLAAYFPIQLKYSDNFELDPNENYILNYHPHGIGAFGCVTAFATNGLGFTKLFPRIKSHFMVHETSFLVPVMRETFSTRGDCSVNSKSFDFILSKKWKQTKEREQEAGHLLALCGGGLAEADLSDSQTLKIVVVVRKGFVKKALIHGANLIPCIAFGENSIFTKINFPPNSLLHRFESRFYSLFKFKHPIYYGSSIFGSDKLRGLMPYKRPITVVMGDPIKVERVEQPSQEQIDHLHAKYMEALHSVYANNKDLCTKYDTKIELV